MLWKVLVPLCLLCLSGLAYEDEDFGYIGKRKLMSVDTDDNAKTEETVTENNQVEANTENQTQNEEEPVTESKEKEDEKNEEEEEEEEEVAYEDAYEGEYEEEEKEAVKPEQSRRRLDADFTKRRMFNGTIVPWHLENTYLLLYTRNQDVQSVPASRWFNNFVPDRDLVVLVHGAWSDSNYIKEYFDSLAYALLNESNYNVIAVDWKYHVVDDWKEDHLAANVHFARLLGIMLHSLFVKHVPEFFSNVMKTYYIGHEIGTIPPITFEERFRKPFNYVYGLDPRKDLPHSSFRLAQEHGQVVSIMTTFDYPYSYAHKNFYVLPRDSSLPYSYHILAKNIVYSGKTGTFCSSADHFRLGYCNMLPLAPVWFTHSYSADISYPTGKYYFYDAPSEIPGCFGKL